jgi:hypothetical protein
MTQGLPAAGRRVIVGAHAMDQKFFNDPALDRLVATTIALAAEVRVLRDRQQALEGVLARQGLVAPADIEGWQPDAAGQAAIDAEAERFVRSVLGPLGADVP